MKKYFLLFALTFMGSSFLTSCLLRKDYHCSIEVTTVISGNGGYQSQTISETKDCNNCTKKQLDELKSQGYLCKK